MQVQEELQMERNELQVFENETFGEIRMVLIDNEPWFVATDVCKILELAIQR